MDVVGSIFDMSVMVPKLVVVALGASLLVGSGLTVSPAVATPPQGYAGFAWGADSSGQLGDGATVNQSAPVTVLAGANASGIWTSLGGGGTFSCGINPAGSAYCWGDNSDGQLGNGMLSSPDDSTPAQSRQARTWRTLGRSSTAVGTSPAA